MRMPYAMLSPSAVTATLSRPLPGPWQRLIWNSAGDRGQGLVLPATRNAPGVDGNLCAAKVARRFSLLAPGIRNEFSRAILVN